MLLPLLDRPIVAWSLRTAFAVEGVRRVVLVVAPGEEAAVSAAVTPYLGEAEVIVVAGGPSRHQSEWNALRVLAPAVESGEVDVVAIHDGARPLASIALFDAVIAAAREHGGALPAVPLAGIIGGPAGADLVGVQTPQAFRAADLLAAYTSAERDGFEGTDTAACLERYRPDTVIAAVDSTPANLKVTFPEDIPLAAELAD